VLAIARLAFGTAELELFADIHVPARHLGTATVGIAILATGIVAVAIAGIAVAGWAVTPFTAVGPLGTTIAVATIQRPAHSGQQWATLADARTAANLFATSVGAAAGGFFGAAARSFGTTTGGFRAAAGSLGASTAGATVATAIVDLPAHAATSAASIPHAAATHLAGDATNNNQCEDVSSRHDPVNSGLTIIKGVTRNGRDASVRRDLSASRFAANHKIVKIDAD
jgi:hypothetical protein